ncbi:MAG: cyclic pyranopterin monophosphate synthase MoaC, partial [Planctomycetota bacterium]
MSEPEGFSHVDAEGRPRMVDVSQKGETRRRALARAELRFSPGVLARVLSGDLPKGAVL